MTKQSQSEERDNWISLLDDQGFNVRVYTSGTIEAISWPESSHARKLLMPEIKVWQARGKKSFKEDWLWLLLKTDYDVIIHPRGYFDAISRPTGLHALKLLKPDVKDLEVRIKKANKEIARQQNQPSEFDKNKMMKKQVLPTDKEDWLWQLMVTDFDVLVYPDGTFEVQSLHAMKPMKPEIKVWEALKKEAYEEIDRLQSQHFEFEKNKLMKKQNHPTDKEDSLRLLMESGSTVFIDPDGNFETISWPW